MVWEKDVYVQSKCDLGDPTDLRFPTCKGLVPGSAHLTGMTRRDLSGQERGPTRGSLCEGIGSCPGCRPTEPTAEGKYGINLSSLGISTRCWVQTPLLPGCLFRGVGAAVCPGCVEEGWLGQPQVCDPL